MSNQVALITGGATGIGKATALKLASQGISVIISGRRQELGDAAVVEIAAVAQGGAEVRFIQNDVSDEAAVKAMIDGIVAEFGRLDMAVNNAGIFNEYCSLDQSGTQHFRDMLDINVVGLYFCMKYEIAQMRKQGQGAIVNLASIAGLNGIPWGGTYAATKHAVVGLTKSAALDHAAEGIRINAVAPGAIRTDIIADQLNNNLAELEAMHPMHRVGKPEEIANGIFWLLSGQSSFVTGHILNVDGGFQAK
ncbi:glucose 1-dehydrogenase [Aeromonas caviae]|uniref:SDR family NAD(P)-dependent oxidoreductase n=1 Tax=Aeromonas TaxID=642 RepID=UPI0006716A77|nr:MULTISPECIES: glucose 1-dehydrogenase [Aeromonas]KMY26301.1 short-chain dehydrogenase [Aeromonas caviae]MBL0499235.1 glucose 1-dehydrogenase [Aeromonas caviae]MCK0186016.1 glucose 1-dehydrogenase [Aeromonas hydrophila]MCR3938920.1 glucose 1-dehydrogenase [Aeromonas caviae]QSO23910.1 glucose 1-dehydrogenase [Aeromonas caviae]